MINLSPTTPRSVPTSTALAAVFLLMAGCATEPPPTHPPPPPPPRGYRPAPPPPNTDVYAYPLHGQPPQQQDRDHYECSVWATQQSGFDPSAPGVPPTQQVHVVSGPAPGSGTATGVVAGAIIGSAIGGPYRGPGGAIAGAVVGGAIGTAAEQSARTSQTVTVADPKAVAEMQQRATNYRRAISACLDARGYSVK